MQTIFFMDFILFIGQPQSPHVTSNNFFLSVATCCSFVPPYSLFVVFNRYPKFLKFSAGMRNDYLFMSVFFS